MPLSASRVFLPGPWTEKDAGIFKAGYDIHLGGHVSSRREQAALARKRGFVHRDDIVVRGNRTPYPDVEQFEKAISELKVSEVAVHMERREKLEFEERSGLRPPDPESTLPS